MAPVSYSELMMQELGAQPEPAQGTDQQVIACRKREVFGELGEFDILEQVCHCVSAIVQHEPVDCASEA